LAMAEVDFQALGEGQAPKPGTVEPQLPTRDRVQRISTADAEPGAAMPNADTRNEGAPAWVSYLQLGVILLLVALAAAIFGRTFRKRSGPESGSPSQAARESKKRQRGRARR
jgi:hypothetical protein